MVEIDMLMLQFLNVYEYRSFNILVGNYSVCVSDHIAKQSAMLGSEQNDQGGLIMVIIKHQYGTQL